MKEEPNGTILNIFNWFKRQKTQFILPSYQEIYIQRISGKNFREIGISFNRSHERIRQIVYNIDQIILRDPLASGRLVTKNNYNFIIINRDIRATNYIHNLIYGSILYIIESEVSIPVDFYKTTLTRLDSIYEKVRSDLAIRLNINEHKDIFPLIERKLSLGIISSFSSDEVIVWKKNSRITKRMVKALSTGAIEMSLLINTILRDTRARYSINTDSRLLPYILISIAKDNELISIDNITSGSVKDTIFSLSDRCSVKLLPVEKAIIELINHNIYSRKEINSVILSRFENITKSSIMAVLSYSPIFLKINRNKYGIVGQRGLQ